MGCALWAACSDVASLVFVSTELLPNPTVKRIAALRCVTSQPMAMAGAAARANKATSPSAPAEGEEEKEKEREKDEYTQAEQGTLCE